MTGIYYLVYICFVGKKGKPKKEMDKSISVKVSSDLLEKARQKSEETGVSLSFIVRKAIEDWVNEK